MKKAKPTIDVDQANKEDDEKSKLSDNPRDNPRKIPTRTEIKKIQKVPVSVILLMILLFLFTLYVHIVRPVSTILEIIYLARMTKAHKLDNAEYYDKALTHFITELDGYYKNQEIFKCFTFDLETGEADIKDNCDPTKKQNQTKFIKEKIVSGFGRYFNILNDLENRLEKKKLLTEKKVVHEGMIQIRSIEEDGNHINPNATDLSPQQSFYRRLVDLKDYFEVIRDQVSSKNVKNTLIFVGWILVFVLPIPTFILFGVKTIYYQENVWASIWATILSLIEVFMNFPLAFLYPDTSSSVYLFMNRGFEHLLSNWLIFFPTNYLTNLYENIRQIAESVFLFVLCMKSYNVIKDNYFENFTEKFLLIIMVFNAIRCFCSIILIFAGFWRWCREREILLKKVKEQQELYEKEKAANVEDNNSQGSKAVETANPPNKKDN